MLTPNSWKWHRIPGNLTPSKKTAFSGGKTKKKLPKFFFWLRDTYKKYILQKNWVKTAIPALSSGQNNLQVPIWGCHRQLDDQHRSPNTNNKDHLVGQLTRYDSAVKNNRNHKSQKATSKIIQKISFFSKLPPSRPPP